jgi:ABC-2 type transport system permease protein
VIWAAAFAGLIALYAVIWPSVRGNISWRNLFDTLPATYRALFTASGTIDLSTAGGYLGVELMGFMGPALIAVCTITAGAAAMPWPRSPLSCGPPAPSRRTISCSATSR